MVKSSKNAMMPLNCLKLERRHYVAYLHTKETPGEKPEVITWHWQVHKDVILSGTCMLLISQELVKSTVKDPLH